MGHRHRKGITIDQMLEIAELIRGLEVDRAEKILSPHFDVTESASIIALFTVRTVERGVGCHIVCKTADILSICAAMLRERKITIMLEGVAKNKQDD